MPDTAPIDSPELLTADAIAARLKVDPAVGLDEAEVLGRRDRWGANELEAAAANPAWRQFLAQFKSPLVYLLLVAVVVTLLVWFLDDAHGWPVDALVILVIVVLNSVLGFVQERRSERAAAALVRMTQATSSVLRQGRVVRVPCRELVPGDVLLLGEGDSVGADARLLQANELLLLESSLTGESLPVRKGVEALAAQVPLAERVNMVFKGTAVAQGNGVAVVTATGMNTEVGTIAHLLKTTPDELTPLQREVSRIGQMLARAVVAIALIVMASMLLTADVNSRADWVAVFLLGVSLAVAAVPEGLPAILSLVLAIGVERMARRKAIVKKLSSVETLGSASVICTDKTGTLTRSEMTIERVLMPSGSSRFEGVGYEPRGQVVHGGEMDTRDLHAELVRLIGAGSLAGNAQLYQESDGSWVVQGDPTEAAFLVAERKLGTQDERQRRFERLAEIPFSSERKMMSVIVRDQDAGNRRLLVSKGAPDVLLERCSYARVGADVVPMSPAIRARALADVESLSDAALRTLAVAYRELAADEDRDDAPALERDLIFLGTVGIIDPPRPEAAQAIDAARQAGIRVIMITGDHPRTAQRIAADLGIIEAGGAVLTGPELDRLDAAALSAAVDKTSVYARVAPVHKLRIVDALQARGHVVAMTGDGVNDAPALKSADIGVAMGVTGTEVTKEAGKMILADDNFATIVAAVREGRGILDNIRKFLRYLLSSNMGEVMTVFFGVLLAPLLGLSSGGALVMPLLATQILWINLITDSGPALAMGVDPHDEGVMQSPPRRPDERVIDGRMWRGVLETGLVMAVATLLALDMMLPGGLIEGDASMDVARTAAFTVLVLAQLFNAFATRSETRSVLSHLLDNGWMWMAVVVGVVLQVLVVEWSWLGRAFGTVPLTAGQWMWCVLLASSVLWWTELRKWALRRRDARVVSATVVA
ncbi:MAG: cation-translocating P-type ATPase [Hydrogenophaga sp.]